MTQRELVKQYLLSNKSITSFEAFQLFGCTRLSSVIYDLKRQGLPIASEKEEQKNRYGETAYFSRYYLKEEN